LDQLDKNRLKDLVITLLKEQPDLEEKVKGEIANIKKLKAAIPEPKTAAKKTTKPPAKTTGKPVAVKRTLEKEVIDPNAKKLQL